MKKIFAIIIPMLVFTLTASAQFEAGKSYIGASLTGLDLSYSGATKLKLGLEAHVGAFVCKDVLVAGRLGWKHNGTGGAKNDLIIGASGRYYIEQNGIFLGASANYVHSSGYGSSYNDVRPAIEVGYAFFVSREFAIEPAIYYEQSFSDHSQHSTVGLKVGIALYHGKSKVKNAVKDAFFE